MKNRAKEAVLASFVGDALSLGVHWIYNTRVIDRKYGRVEELLEPKLASFHKGKPKGAFTHYGDQMFVLLAAMAEGGETNLLFMKAWLKLMESGSCYVDKASQETMDGLKGGKEGEGDGAIGSSSTDLGGAARIAPLLLAHHESSEDLVDAARMHTGLTHNTDAVRDAAGFFACTAKLVLDGCEPLAAMDIAIREAGGSAELREAIQDGIESRETDTREAIESLGQACDISGALPSTIHLIARYENSLKEALIENVMAGGDSATRGMLAGLVLGAKEGVERLPSEWMTGMHHYKEIEGLLGAM